jgi:hypothetical protein
MSFVMKSIGILSISIALGYFYHPFLDNDHTKDTVSILMNVSAATFAIAGLWISQIYPEAMKAYTLPNVSIVEASEKSKRIESLILTISTSAFVIVILLITQYLYPLEKIALGTSYEDNINWFKAAVLLFLSFLQLVALLKLTYGMFIFTNQLHRKVKELKAQKKLD